jgi:hypothetical protein
MSKGGFRMNTKGMSARLDALSPRLQNGITGIFEYQKSRSEGRMRTGARWTDRTGNARSSLFALPLRTGNTWKLVVSHGMSYGIYLEASNSGKYAIVIPEILLAGQDLMRLSSKLLATIK